jgi:hypothetical protein
VNADWLSGRRGPCRPGPGKGEGRGRGGGSLCLQTSRPQSLHVLEKRIVLIINVKSPHVQYTVTGMYFYVNVAKIGTGSL